MTLCPAIASGIFCLDIPPPVQDVGGEQYLLVTSDSIDDKEFH
jgi:hypothetical protein